MMLSRSRPAAGNAAANAKKEEGKGQSTAALPYISLPLSRTNHCRCHPASQTYHCRPASQTHHCRPAIQLTAARPPTGEDSLKWSDFVERRDYTGALAVRVICMGCWQ